MPGRGPDHASCVYQAGRSRLSTRVNLSEQVNVAQRLGGRSPRRSGQPAEAPPRPRGNPLLGWAPDLRRSQTEAYARVMREQGDVVRLDIGPPGLRLDLYCVFHPDGVREVLAGSREAYSKRNRFYRQIAEAFGSGLLTAEGDLWQRQRRLIQPLFTRKAIASYADLMAEEAEAVATRWERAAGEGRGVDANADMVRLTLRVVGRSIFGDDVERAVEVLDTAFPVLNRRTFRRATSPLVVPASWPTPENRRAARAREALYGVVDELIARRAQEGADGDDLVSRLLSARDADTGEAMDLQQVRDEALIFLLAGHETTSTALTFTLHLLGRHPREQAWVHDELDAVLGSRLPTTDDLPALARTAMAIKEAMRLYPPAYALGRQSEQDAEIGGYAIPAGSNVLVSQYATHRHPRVWDDPEAFDPTRFAPEREEGRHRYAYFPFGAGPRACIGSHFAMLEAVFAVAVLLQRCHLRSQLAAVPLDTQGITLRPRGAVPLEVEPRSLRGAPAGSRALPGSGRSAKMRGVSSEDMKRLARRALEEIYTRANLELVDELVAPGFVDHEPDHGDAPAGPASVRATVERLHGAFGELRFTVEEEVAEGDRVAQLVTMSGRHTGPLMGRGPSGRRFAMRHAYFWRIADGRLIEHWGSRDDLGLLRQLGLLPPG